MTFPSLNGLIKRSIGEWQLFCLSVMFFTRFPVPQSTPYSEALMNKSNRYFPLVGFLLALLLCVLYVIFNAILPLDVTVVLIVIASLLFTGAFHEDGLADMADGIGGGLTVERRLSIMKDSRIGTYGTVSLVLSLLLKFVLLLALAEHQLFIPSLLIAYTVSRALAATIIVNTNYVTDDSESKSKPLASQQSATELLFVIASGLLTLLMLINEPWFFTFLISLVAVLVLFRFFFRHWLIKRIGGFTGDCLGAGQQMSELLIYLTLLAVYQAYLSEKLPLLSSLVEF
ncbi:adenosylcobinamide-GDP ribazoletransferase [Thalassotalea piscium]|uniref:Adenosylcobinamide-GDP ribazoletransferase n=1 Tax=Thalassotalea piscium TaxID=1230533 RepID=A0A7X0NK90_9GAMM|nr:adenosylcobinamide-GDP ribazoletransferase [Thalassotalea piscium]MBB6544983.1 adenosylcobinamide-GDP ribazoletransferase [Thalassotalea piscium]